MTEVYRFEIIKTLTSYLPLLRTQQSLLLEHKRGANKDSRTNCQKNPDPVAKDERHTPDFDVVLVVTHVRYSFGCVELDPSDMMMKQR